MARRIPNCSVMCVRSCRWPPGCASSDAGWPTTSVPARLAAAGAAAGDQRLPGAPGCGRAAGGVPAPPRRAPQARAREGDRVVVRNLVVHREPVYALGEWAGPFDPALLG